VPPSPARAPVAGPSPTNAVGRRRASGRRPLVPAAARSCRPPPARAVAVAGSCRRRRLVPECRLINLKLEVKPCVCVCVCVSYKGQTRPCKYVRNWNDTQIRNRKTLEQYGHSEFPKF